MLPPRTVGTSRGRRRGPGAAYSPCSSPRSRSWISDGMEARPAASAWATRAVAARTSSGGARRVSARGRGPNEARQSLGSPYRGGRRAGSPAGSTSAAHSLCFQPGTGVGTAGRGTNAERSTSWYLWM